MMQQIIFSENRFGQLLHFEEAFSKKKVAYEKIKVCDLRGKCFAIFYF
jgi:hypothetical protein